MRQQKMRRWLRAIGRRGGDIAAWDARSRWLTRDQGRRSAERFDARYEVLAGNVLIRHVEDTGAGVATMNHDGSLTVTFTEGIRRVVVAGKVVL